MILCGILFQCLLIEVLRGSSTAHYSLFFTIPQHVQWSAAEQEKPFLVYCFHKLVTSTHFLYLIYLFEALKHFASVFHCNSKSNSDKSNMAQKSVFTTENTVNAHKTCDFHCYLSKVSAFIRKRLCLNAAGTITHSIESRIFSK